MDFKNIKFTVIPSPPDPRDWKVEKIYKAIKLPVELDYRGDLMPIRDQGSQGSCAAMAAAAMKEWQERKDIGLMEYFSPQFIYNNRENQNSSGMYTRDVMKILSNLGDCRENTFPYGDLNKPDQKAYEEARKYPIGSYAFVETVEGLKTSLFENGPVMIAFPVYNFGGRFWKKDPGEYLLGYHMVLVVGYSDIKKNFIIRNSWGDDWGENGYTYFPYEDWGWQEEIATTVDTDSDNYIPPIPDGEKSWLAKYWWIILILLAIGAAIFFSSCDPVQPYEPKQAGLTWEYQRDFDQGVTHFVLYGWSGKDTNQVRLDSIGTFPFDFVNSPDTMEYRPFPITDAYSQAGIIAVDSTGLTSSMTKTRFVGYWELYGPEPPTNANIRK